jgi:hydroxymethylglutaryl-CoA lyase
MKTEIMECPRDAMQGLPYKIATADKIRYLNALLDCHFPILDCGSFVSPRVIPQMSDTMEVLNGLKPSEITALLVIVANLTGAKKAIAHPRVQILGYPFSISSEFQMRNSNKTIVQTFEELTAIKELATRDHKKVLVYISMGFGNPYGEKWSISLVEDWVGKLIETGITTFSLSDTIGCAHPDDVYHLFNRLIHQYPQIVFGAHFHTRYDQWRPVLSAAYEAGCRRFDGAINGLGGCPMAKDALTGNLPTEHIISYLNEIQATHEINEKAFDVARKMASQLFMS